MSPLLLWLYCFHGNEKNPGGFSGHGEYRSGNITCKPLRLSPNSQVIVRVTEKVRKTMSDGLVSSKKDMYVCEDVWVGWGVVVMRE